MEMVELESVEADGGKVDAAQVATDLTQYDESRLKRIIEQHKHYTNSAPAQRVLDNWAEMRKKFVKVMPVDYKRALQSQYAAAQSETAQTQEVTHG